ncbi:MAG: hypothetical protein QOF68_1344, partial [Gaiellales bacterium]|nr:hypothetical protein [Gaiellales bacterium]
MTYLRIPTVMLIGAAVVAWQLATDGM